MAQNILSSDSENSAKYLDLKRLKIKKDIAKMSLEV
jgi:hypothetical protein